MRINGYLSEKECEILESAHIGVAGAGGLGSNCLLNLVRSGVTTFTVADFDRVSSSNLNRQFFFFHQLGDYKCDALAHNLHQINPELQIKIFNIQVTSENFDLIFGDCDIIVEAFDQAEAKRMLISAALKRNKIVISGSGLAGIGNSNTLKVHKINNQLYLIGDLSSEISTANAPQSPRVNIVAAMQANTVLALLLGREV
ncbi:MAG: sulfur carrier protein ThiS adenylyltransferase ThiF [Lentisphaeria bacterium]|nr:sulfur carrier protein ThiS adenylyltransferase ThiF [Lentisphaeria bacterium]